MSNDQDGIDDNEARDCHINYSDVVKFRLRLVQEDLMERVERIDDKSNREYGYDLQFGEILRELNNYL
jgi:hypothetical protein